MRLVALFLLVLGAALGAASSVAGPAAPGAGRGGAPPPHGGGQWGGGHPHGSVGHYRPVYGPRYGGWWVGYPGYGFGLGLGLGYGYGYGTGWALTGGYPWYYWGGPAYGVYPYGFGVTSVPALIASEDLVFVQQPPTDAASAPPPSQASRGYWYYCTAPAGYYPYVEQCTRPWIAVQPQAGAPAR